MIDLHLHTTFSDGAYTLEQVLAAAREAKLKAISITDHDTLAAYRHMPPSPGVEIIPGIELSCFWHQQLMHLLGYFLDVERGTPNTEHGGASPVSRVLSAGSQLHTYLQRARERNQDIVRDVCDHLREKEGIPVHYEELLEKKAGNPTLALLALRLLTRGHAKDWREVGAIWGRIHRELENRHPPPRIEDGIAALRDAQALIVVAHPGSLAMSNSELDREEVSVLKEMGIQGLEVYHKRHNAVQSERYLALAGEMGLAISGGPASVKLGLWPRRVSAKSVNWGITSASPEQFSREIFILR